MVEVCNKYGFPINQVEDDGKEDCEVSDLARLLEHEEKEIQPHKEPIEVINLGSDEVRREVQITTSLVEHVHTQLVKLIHEYVDVFFWSYQDIPGLDTNIVKHHLRLKPECPLVKHKLHRTRHDMALKIREEVKKQFDVGFLDIVEYP